MSQLYVDNIRNRTGGPIGIPTGAVVTGVLTATTANVTGNMTVGGVLTYEDVTNIDSVGIITARSGIEFGASGVGGTITATGQAEFAGVCTASSFSGSFDGSTASFSGNVSIADSIVHTGDTDTAIRFPAADTFTVETAGSERLRVDSSGNFGIGTANPGGKLHVESAATTAGWQIRTDSVGLSNESGFYRDASDHYELVLRNGSGGLSFIKNDGGASTANLGFTVQGSERMRITSTGGFHFTNGELIEQANITAGKLSDNTNIDLENGMVHLFTTQETTTSTPNIRINSSTSLNSVMAIGEVISVTLITTAAAAGYSAQLTIDGGAVTENWTGGSAPSDGGSSGVDIYAYTIIKTADATFTVVATQTKTS